MVVLVFVTVSGMTLAGCGPIQTPIPSQTPDRTPTQPPPTEQTPAPEGGGNAGNGATETGEAPAGELAIPCPTPPIKQGEDWEGIVNVLWYEGASSFSGNNTEIVFRKELWALRSEGKYDASFQGKSYSLIVQDIRYSARGHFLDKDHPWPSGFVRIAQEILSDQMPAPQQFDSEAIYFISATHFQRIAPKELNDAILRQNVTSLDPKMPEKCRNDDYCAFPEIRFRNEVKKNAVDDQERGIPMLPGTYSLNYPTYYINKYEECYWIGIYFNPLDIHNSIYASGNNTYSPDYPQPPNFDPNSNDADVLKCPVDLPQE